MNQTVVRFYVLAATEPDVRLKFVRVLCRKALQQREKTTVICADEASAAQLGELLWLDRPAAFIANARLGDPLAEKAAVQLVVCPERGAARDVLINLGDQTQPDIPNGCKRVFEVVIQCDQVLAVTRKRYRHYVQRGLAPEKVTIDA